jgi:O-antigen/teichoic acid export membrane protein
MVMEGRAPATRTFRLTDGVLRGFAAELLLLPTGLITAAVATRVLGPTGYGIFSIAATFIAWMSWTTTALLARAAVKFVSESDDWRVVATSVLRWRLGIGAASFLLVGAGAGTIARMLDTPELTPYLRVFALDLLLFNLARAYREVLTGRGRFREVAAVSVVRWSVRMLLIVAFVLSTRSVMAAVIGSIGATLAELLWAHRLEPLSLRGRCGISFARMLGVAAPLMIYGAAIQLYSRLDLFALSVLGGTPEGAGFYAAAQNLAVGPGLFALAVGPLLLATLANLRRSGEDGEARRIGRIALRVTLALIPLAAIVGGSATEIVQVIFGPPFVASGPLLGLLFAAAVALALMAVAVAIITAADHQRVVSVLGIATLLAAAAGHAIMIPRLAAVGAALVTAIVGAAGAVLAVLLVHRYWQVHAYGTMVRAAIIAVPAYLISSAVRTHGPVGLALELTLISAAATASFVLLGELSVEEHQQWIAPRLRRRPADAGAG